MSIHMEFDSTCGILRAQITSQFDVSEYREALKEITSGKHYPPTTPTIWDLRELDFSDIEINIAYIVKQVRTPFPIRNDARIAYVVSSQLAYGSMRLLQAITVSEEMSLVCYNYDDAEKWVLDGVQPSNTIPHESES